MQNLTSIGNSSFRMTEVGGKHTLSSLIQGVANRLGWHFGFMEKF